jgi:hypothetical protein
MDNSSYVVREHIYTDPYTTVVIESKTHIGSNEVIIEGRGMTKRDKRDVPNKTIGYEVALARAIEDVRAKRIALKERAKANKAKAARAAEYRKKAMAEKLEVSTV